ncbi:MAG: MotA/TolQ/ExbB proton channel family protein [Candidatus Oxydemutatoraceae bacterium WSBS_2016_MAG_OTU14]
MNKHFHNFLLGACLSLLMAGGASAQTSKTEFFESLFQEFTNITRSDEQKNQQREEQFLQRQEQQATLLKQAQANNQGLKKRLEALELQWRENETQLGQLEKTHQKRVGNFVEIGGLFKQFSNQLFSIVSNSVLQFHLPNWEENLTVLRKQEGLPSLDKIEMLWQTMLKYLIVQGKTVRFSSAVVQTDGSLQKKDAVNIGPFTVVSSEGFLSYLPNSRKLAELARQPASRLIVVAQDYFSADSGVVPAPIDPSRGTLLNLLIATPTFQERIQQGGWIGYFIILIALIGVGVSIWRGIVLRKIYTDIQAQKKDLERKSDNPLAHLFAVYQANRHEKIDTLEIKLDEAITKELPGLEYGLNMLKVFAAVTPLLGLLGTVVGMLDTFQAITLFGSGDPKIMAGGISQALMTTAMGLMAAIPLLLIYTYLASQSRMIQDILQEQGVGLLAAYMQKN